MRVLVVGAGASIEEAKRANVPEELWPPNMVNFAKKMWDSPPLQFFNYWLPDYLIDQGIQPGSDPTSVFIKLASDPNNSISVERLFEYCWRNKGKNFADDWENLIYHGILNPLVFQISRAFYVNGSGVKQLGAGKLVSGNLKNGDLVLNLNYETLFEIAATQQGRQLTYIPNQFDGSSILIAKPHGSFNLLADENKFHFAQPDCIGAVASSANNYRNWRAIVPPRFNKSYAQHGIAKIIFESVVDYSPNIVTFWGVGLTDSDTDLLDVYKKWAASAAIIEVINPSDEVAIKAKGIFNRDIRHCSTIEEWLTHVE